MASSDTVHSTVATYRVYYRAASMAEEHPDNDRRRDELEEKGPEEGNAFTITVYTVQHTPANAA